MAEGMISFVNNTNFTASRLYSLEDSDQAFFKNTCNLLSADRLNDLKLTDQDLFKNICNALSADRLNDLKRTELDLFKSILENMSGDSFSEYFFHNITRTSGQGFFPERQDAPGSDSNKDATTANNLAQPYSASHNPPPTSMQAKALTSR